MMSFFRRLFGTKPAGIPAGPFQLGHTTSQFCLEKLDSERREDGVKANGFQILRLTHTTTSSAGHGLGFTINTFVSPSREELRQAGFYIFKVAGVSYRPEALQDKAFKPGSILTLVPENNNPYDVNAVSVWDEQRKQMVGYVPREDNQAIRTMLRLHPEYRAICLREYRKSRRRVGLLAMCGPPTVTKEE